MLEMFARTDTTLDAHEAEKSSLLDKIMARRPRSASVYIILQKQNGRQWHPGPRQNDAYMDETPHSLLTAL